MRTGITVHITQSIVKILGCAHIIVQKCIGQEISSLYLKLLVPEILV